MMLYSLAIDLFLLAVILFSIRHAYEYGFMKGREFERKQKEYRV
jgi:hypothetical protein